MVEFRQPTTDRALLKAAESLHHAWNDALARKDAEALAALYTEDAVIESPLVAYLLGTERVICSGKQAIRNFLPMVFANQPEQRRTYRQRYLPTSHCPVSVQFKDTASSRSREVTISSWTQATFKT